MIDRLAGAERDAEGDLRGAAGSGRQHHARQAAQGERQGRHRLR